MRFDDDFLQKIPNSTHQAGRMICKEFENFDGESKANPIYYYEAYLKALALLQAICEVNQIKFPDSQLPSDKSASINKIRTIFAEIRKIFDQTETSMAFNNYRDLFTQKFNVVFAYEFSEGDIKRIQQLINELRELISNTKEFEEDHQRRLLKRLEKLQAELHKRVSDLDHFWGLIGEAGIILGKFGEDAKPIVDRVREIIEIAWNVQTRAAQLPSNTPMKLLSSNSNAEQ